MKKVFTISTVMTFILLMSFPAIAQDDFVADGYTKILEINKFEGAPHYPIVADEVHAGFDLDKDGNLEFIVLADHSLPNGPAGEWTDGHSVYVYEWNPTGSAFELMWSWADTSLKTGGASYPTMAVADLDGDGDQEIVFGIPSGTDWPAPDVSPTVIFIFEFGSAGLPTEPTATWTADSDPGSNTRPSGMAAGDIDGDGVMEVAVAFRAFSTASTNDALMIFSVDGGFAGAFTQFKTEMIDTTGDWGSVYAVDITDLDNDGNLEAYFSTDNHTVYEATGADTYTLSYVEKPTVGPWTIQATAEADIDGDGNNELVFGKTDGSFGLWHGITDVANTDSTNEALIALVAPSGCRGLTVGDYDGDGKTDIFMGGNYEGSIWRIEYNGTGAITDSASYSYEKIFEDTTNGPRAYHVSFSGDYFALQHGGSVSTDMNVNGEPEVLVAIAAAGDSTQNWIIMIEGNGVTGIQIDPGQQILKSYTLHQNYPNPFNPSTTISYQLTKTEKISIKVYDLLGKEINTLVSGVVTAGTHTAVWNGTNNAGAQVASGIYIYTLQVGKYKLNKRMTLMR